MAQAQDNLRDDLEEQQDFATLFPKSKKRFVSDRIKDILPKDQCPDQSQALTSSLNALEAILEQERVGFRYSRQSFSFVRSHSVVASYDQKTRRIWVDHPKGTFAQTMGHFECGKLHLLPEEALYLLERSTIVLDHVRGAPMSIQEAYHELLRIDGDFEKYQVYAYLKKLGYIIMPFGWSGAQDDQERLWVTNLSGRMELSRRKWPLIHVGLYTTSSKLNIRAALIFQMLLCKISL